MRFRCVYNCRFLSTSASYVALADSFRLGIYAVHYIIKEVCEAIWKNHGPSSYACTYNRNATCDIKRILSYVEFSEMCRQY